jgi:U3 small nucleolar RNA-associated protein 14
MTGASVSSSESESESESELLSESEELDDVDRLSSSDCAERSSTPSRIQASIAPDKSPVTNALESGEKENVLIFLGYSPSDS